MSEPQNRTSGLIGALIDAQNSCTALSRLLSLLSSEQAGAVEPAVSDILCGASHLLLAVASELQSVRAGLSAENGE